MTEHTPWAGSLSVDLRKGALSVNADGLTVIDEKGVCWGIVFPDKRGHYDHANVLIKAVNSHEAMQRRIVVLEQVIKEELHGWDCHDGLNKMIVDEIQDRTLSVVSSPSGGE